MAKTTDGKLKILYVKDILEQTLQSGRAVSMRQAIKQIGICSAEGAANN